MLVETFFAIFMFHVLVTTEFSNGNKNLNPFQFGKGGFQLGVRARLLVTSKILYFVKFCSDFSMNTCSSIAIVTLDDTVSYALQLFY